MVSRPNVRAGYARASILAMSLACLPLQAAPDSFSRQLARNATLPAAEPLKEEDLARRARLSQVKLSPDGARIVYIETEGQGNSLKLLEVRSGARKKLLAMAERAELHWSGDSSVVFIDSGDGLAAVTIADGAASKIAAFDSKAAQRFVQVDPSHPRHALTEAWDRGARRYRISRMGFDGASEVVYEGDKKAAEFLVDAAGEVSFMRTVGADFSQVVWGRQDGKWVAATRCQRLRHCQLVSASSDLRHLTMAINQEGDRKALVRFDLNNKSMRVLHTDPLGVSDLWEAPLAPGAQQPLFAVYDLPARRNYGLNPAARRAASVIARRFPGSNISIGASTGASWLLTERSARLSQERYWLYEHASGKTTEILERERSLGNPLPEAQLAQKIAFDYRAGDGATLHAYLSLPPGRAAASLPMVTMVHGGPWGKFDSAYAPLVQLLVNRGYAVFQPNFRASTGYGGNYMRAPKSDFGNGRVQADIIDGVRWLLANGVGNKQRLAIMGDSFGGYAALLALTHTPDLFKFGMAMTPPTDFSRNMKSMGRAPASGDNPPFLVTLAEMGVDLGDDAAMQRIAASAPAANAAKVVRPLLILAGGQDQIVDVAGVTDYVARLQALGKPVSLLLDPDENHNSRKPMLRAAYTHLLLRMLHEHLGGPAVPAPTPELAAYLAQNLKVNTALK